MDYRDYEAQVQSAQKGPKMAPVECKNCKCTWFEQVKVSKFDSNLMVAPMQGLPEMFHVFTLIRCARCGDLQEIPASQSGWDRLSQDRYSELITELEKGPPVKEPAKPEEPKKP